MVESIERVAVGKDEAHIALKLLDSLVLALLELCEHGAKVHGVLDEPGIVGDIKCNRIHLCHCVSFGLLLKRPASLLTGVWKPYDSLRFMSLCTRDSILACKDGCSFTGASVAGDLDTACEDGVGFLDGLGTGDDLETEGDLTIAGEAGSMSMCSDWDGIAGGR